MMDGPPLASAAELAHCTYKGCRPCEGQTLPGTLQAVCVHQPFDEASRLGLPADTEAELRARQPSLRGVLVLSELLPEGPAAAALEVGDILLKVGGEWCTSFVELEAALDDSVGGSVALTVCRGTTTGASRI